MSRKAVADVRLECLTVEEARAFAALLSSLINDNSDAAALGVSITFKEPRAGHKGGILTYGMLSTGIEVPDDAVPAPAIPERRMYPYRGERRQGR